MSAQIARYDGPRTTDELIHYSQAMTSASVLPRQFRDNPGSVMFAVEYAKALDVSPVTAITGMHIIEGKPAASAGLISALIRRAGHQLRVGMTGTYEGGDLAAWATIVRSDDPETVYRSDWSFARAARAKLVFQAETGLYRAVKSGSAWDTYPESMLKARAITEVGRDAAEDALLGVHYTPEELGAEIDENGDAVHVVTTVPRQAERVASERVDTPPPAAAQNSAEPDLAALADAAREGILAARTMEDLARVWKGPEIASSQARAEVLVTADPHDVECTVMDLFGQAANAIKAGTYVAHGTRYDDAAKPTAGGSDADGAVDADVVPDTAREQLDAVMGQLDEQARSIVYGWAEQNHVNPNQGDEQAAVLLDAIKSGQALPISVDPLELLKRALGAEVIETVVHTTFADKARAAMRGNA